MNNKPEKKSSISCVDLIEPSISYLTLMEKIDFMIDYRLKTGCSLVEAKSIADALLWE